MSNNSSPTRRTSPGHSGSAHKRSPPARLSMSHGEVGNGGPGNVTSPERPFEGPLAEPGTYQGADEKECGLMDAFEKRFATVKCFESASTAAPGGAAHAARLGVLYLESFTELLHTLHLVPHVLSAAECNVLYRAVVRRKKVHQDRRMEHPEFVEAIRRIGAWRGERLWSLPTETLRNIERTTVGLALTSPPQRPRPASAHEMERLDRLAAPTSSFLCKISRVAVGAPPQQVHPTGHGSPPGGYSRSPGHGGLSTGLSFLSSPHDGDDDDAVAARLGVGLWAAHPHRHHPPAPEPRTQAEQSPGRDLDARLKQLATELEQALRREASLKEEVAALRARPPPAPAPPPVSKVMKEALALSDARVSELEERCTALAHRNEVLEKGARDRSVVIKAQQEALCSLKRRLAAADKAAAAAAGDAKSGKGAVKDGARSRRAVRIQEDTGPEGGGAEGEGAEYAALKREIHDLQEQLAAEAGMALAHRESDQQHIAALRQVNLELRQKLDRYEPDTRVNKIPLRKGVLLSGGATAAPAARRPRRQSTGDEGGVKEGAEHNGVGEVVLSLDVAPSVGQRVRAAAGFRPKGVGTVEAVQPGGAECVVVWDSGRRDTAVPVGLHGTYALALDPSCASPATQAFHEKRMRVHEARAAQRAEAAPS